MATLDQPYTWDGDYKIIPIDPDSHPLIRLDTTGDLVQIILGMSQEQRAANHEHATKSGLNEVLDAHEELIQLLLKKMGFD